VPSYFTRLAEGTHPAWTTHKCKKKSNTENPRLFSSSILVFLAPGVAASLIFFDQHHKYIKKGAGQSAFFKCFWDRRCIPCCVAVKLCGLELLFFG
jgi:hypothetical protein